MANRYVKVDPYNLGLEHVYPPRPAVAPSTPPQWMVESFRSRRMTLLPCRPHSMVVAYEVLYGDRPVGSVVWDTSCCVVTARADTPDASYPGGVTLCYLRHGKPSAERFMALVDYLASLCRCAGCGTMSRAYECPHCKAAHYCSVGCVRRHRLLHRERCMRACRETCVREHDSGWQVSRSSRCRYRELAVPMRPLVAPRSVEEWRACTVADPRELSLLDVPRDALVSLVFGRVDQVMRTMLASTCTTFRRALPVRKVLPRWDGANTAARALVSGHLTIFRRYHEGGVQRAWAYSRATLREALVSGGSEVAECALALRILNRGQPATLLKDMVTAGRGDVVGVFLRHYGVRAGLTAAPGVDERDRQDVSRMLSHLLSPLLMRVHVYNPGAIAALHSNGLLKRGSVSSHVRRAYLDVAFILEHSAVADIVEGEWDRLYGLYHTTRYLLSVGFLTAARARAITGHPCYELCHARES
jgi:hypothetical protein